MTDKPVDKLVQRIEARRAEAAKQQGGVGRASQAQPEPVQPPPAAPAERFEGAAGPLAQIVAARAAIDVGENQMVSARRLAALLSAHKLKRKDLAEKIGKSEAWLSKRLGLLNATRDIHHLIEAGELSESEYYDNRANVAAGVRGKGGGVQYKRVPTITLNIEAARALAEVLQHLAKVHELAPIRIDAHTTKKDLINILTLRAGEIRGVLS